MMLRKALRHLRTDGVKKVVTEYIKECRERFDHCEIDDVDENERI